jgi:hypothetical protein
VERNGLYGPVAAARAVVFEPWVPGAALFTAFAKGAGFSFIRNTLRTKKKIGIDQRERENRESENPRP